MQKRKMKSIENEKRKIPSVYLFYGLWSDKEVEFPCQIAGGTLATKASFQNSPNGKTTSGKNKLPTLIFIECFEFPKIYCNLFCFEIQIILAKVGFYFYLSIVLENDFW